MGGGDGLGYVGVDISEGRVMTAQRSSRRLFVLILVGLVLPDSLVSCVFCFAYFVFCFAKNVMFINQSPKIDQKLTSN